MLKAYPVCPSPARYADGAPAGFRCYARIHHPPYLLLDDHPWTPMGDPDVQPHNKERSTPQ
ncbi:MAG: hypothetical protein M8467_17910 [Anaerolineae bacterium]|nr:hypothetical protein [Anaerolineae bacterium]